MTLRLRPLLWTIALLSAGCSPPSTPVTLDTEGGDAWTFQKLVEARVPADACDTVEFASPIGSAIAYPDGERVMARVPLAHGENIVEATCRKNGLQQGQPARQHWVVPLRDVPHAEIRVAVTPAGIELNGGATRPAVGKPAPLVNYEWRAREGNPAPLNGLPAQSRDVVLPAPHMDGEYYVTMRATDAGGRADESTTAFRVREGRPETIDLAREQPAWLNGAVVYGVVPFFFGQRGLADVTARLDDLAELGIDVLWLSPITRSASGDFGYGVTDLFRVRPDFGTARDLRDLVAAAHDRGMRIIMDFVPNHLSTEHGYYADAVARERASPYFNFFARGQDEETAHYFDWQNLKNLDYDNPEVQRMLIEAFAHWVREFDVDGFRVDVAWGPRERAPEFWPRWRAELKRIKPDLLLLAEASARDPYYVTHGFDAAYDWTERLGEWAWHDAFEDQSNTAGKLRQAITAQGPSGSNRTFRFLNNNDTGLRFVTRYGPERTRVASAMLLTLPGLPSLYTGDEVGAEFEPYSEGPPLSWEDRAEWRDWYRRLIDLRRQSPALRSGSLRMLDIEPRDQVLAYVRSAGNPEDAILVLLNYGAEPVRVALPPDSLPTAGPQGRLTDLLDGADFTLKDGPGISLPAHGVRILRASEPHNG
jgi:cyclomaltodextrinase